MSNTKLLNDTQRVMLRALYDHRLLTTTQLACLAHPTASRRYVQRLLADLAARELVESVRKGAVGECRWFLSEHGYEAAMPYDEGDRRPYRMSLEKASGQLAEHTLSVNSVCVSLTVWARRHGDEFGATSWLPEVRHFYGRGGRDWFSSDAVLHYEARTVTGANHLETRFLELDRGTETVQRVVDKVVAYTRYSQYEVTDRGKTQLAFESRYPYRFPKVWIVFDAKVPAPTRRTTALANRLAQDRRLADSQIEVAVCTAANLEQRGPFAPEVSTVVLSPVVDGVCMAPAPLIPDAGGRRLPLGTGRERSEQLSF